jgi:hypothetical protein
VTSIVREPPAGWNRVSDRVDAIPIWQWHDELFYVATRDMDQLLFIGVALARFDRMTGEQLQAFVMSST